MIFSVAHALLLSITVSAGPRQADLPKDSPEVVRARERAVAFLVQQQKDGKVKEFEGSPTQPGGLAALTSLSLLKSGVKPEDPRIGKLLARVRAMEPKTTYVVSLQTRVLCAAEPKKDMATIRRNVKWLEESQLGSTEERKGAWTYGPPREPGDATSHGDNSNTQFAMFALYDAERAGASAKRQTWKLALDYWLANQNEDGAWGYNRWMDGTGSMTCAGLACVSIASKRVDDKAKVEAATRAIKRGSEWLAKHFSVERNPRPLLEEHTNLWHFCYLYDLERAGRLTKQSKFGDHDWRAEGVRELLKAQDDESGAWKGDSFAETDPLIATSLALLFLAPEMAEKPHPKQKR